MCPACAEKRLHTTAEWEYHKYSRHGFNGNIWTHPDMIELASGTQAGAASQRQISGEVVAATAAPATQENR